MRCIGLDVGGTKIEGILFDSKKILKKIKLKTKKQKRYFLSEIEQIITDLSKGEKISGIGIGFPGTVDRIKGKIITLPSLPHIKNFDIVKKLEKKFKVPVKIENDANCMALAVSELGIGKNKKNIVCLTLGTGIGGGIIINNKLYVGKTSAGEIGHINIEPEGIKCFCGNKGCFEEYASSRGVMRFSKKLKIKANNPKEVEDMARSGDKRAKLVYEKIGYYLGVGCSTITCVLDPELIVISGSIANASDLFLKISQKELDKRIFFDGPKIKVSKLKHAPVLGAALINIK